MEHNFPTNSLRRSKVQTFDLQNNNNPSLHKKISASCTSYTRKLDYIKTTPTNQTNNILIMKITTILGLLAVFGVVYSVPLDSEYEEPEMVEESTTADVMEENPTLDEFMDTGRQKNQKNPHKLGGGERGQLPPTPGYFMPYHPWKT